ncbi:energy transducer TonB [Pseudoxanthomonas sp. PXM05]|uniref:energy transducer TonB n=1 Tax=Pseudoxanthomonas sp. PXM05 TaxID=2854775 RepID=UPI001C45CF00|nr:energy transducer TonB [Pseudoxanthomonas sp. PXM05]MBV7475009.1 energy transducer TonB [Pseudoxanthomonas sp. PXM05]
MRILLLLATSTVLAATLSACGGSGTPAAPVAAPTELAAVDTPPPEYPIELACAGIGGVSTLKVVVGIEGVPTEVGVFKSSGQPALDEAAQKAVHGWQFKAATRNGQAISQTIQVPVTFTPPAERPNQCFALDSQRQG